MSPSVVVFNISMAKKKAIINYFQLIDWTASQNDSLTNQTDSVPESNWLNNTFAAVNRPLEVKTIDALYSRVDPPYKLSRAPETPGGPLALKDDFISVLF